MKEDTVVIKVGSSSIIRGENRPEQNAADNIDWIAEQIAPLTERSNVIVVTSGAVALGKAMWPELADQPAHEVDQFLAMSGNPIVMSMWLRSFRSRGIKAGELLATDQEIEDDKEAEAPGSVLRAALDQAWSVGGVVIANGNDALSRRELNKEGVAKKDGFENDAFSLHLAKRFGASLLMLLTESNGVINHKYGERRRVVPATERSWESVGKLVLPTASSEGSGGMAVKAGVAIEAVQAGIETYIAPADKSFKLIFQGVYGTRFEPVAQEGTLEASGS